MGSRCTRGEKHSQEGLCLEDGLPRKGRRDGQGQSGPSRQSADSGSAGIGPSLLPPEPRGSGGFASDAGAYPHASPPEAAHDRLHSSAPFSARSPALDSLFPLREEADEAAGNEQAEVPRKRRAVDAIKVEETDETSALCVSQREGNIEEIGEESPQKNEAHCERERRSVRIIHPRKSHEPCFDVRKVPREKKNSRPWEQDRGLPARNPHANANRHPELDGEDPRTWSEETQMIMEEGNKVFSYNFPVWDSANDPDLSLSPLCAPTDSPVQRWTDPAGRVTLSAKQLRKVHQWVRISALGGSRMMSPGTRAHHICQGFVGDCSFLSSIASLVEHEWRFKRPFLPKILYPQNAEHEPVINPAGKYACRMYLNGVPRKVLVDDFVPVRQDGKIASAHLSNMKDMWVTLLEKAFIKIMGGTFWVQGSSPATDLYHLTGWVPETLPLHNDASTTTSAPPAETSQLVVTGTRECAIRAKSPVFDGLWERITTGLDRGHCVVCLGTSDLVDAAPSGRDDFPEGVSLSSGIVARHAYAALRFVEIKKCRLVLLRNPWGCVTWRQPLPAHITAADLAAASDLPLKSSGIFWIPWQKIIQWFSHLYISWDPAIFPFQTKTHAQWGDAPALQRSSLPDDSHNVLFNPQLRLEVLPYISRDASEDARLSQLFNVHPRPAPSDITASSSPPQRLPASYAVLNRPQSPPPACRNSDSVSAQSNAHYKAQLKAKLTCVVWVVFCRHVKDRHSDLSERYIACHAHEARRRLICPASPSYQGVYTNGECGLVCLRITRRIVFSVDPDWKRQRLRWSHQTNILSLAKPDNQSPLSPLSQEEIDFYSRKECAELNSQENDVILLISQYAQKTKFNFSVQALSPLPVMLTVVPPLIDSNFVSFEVPGHWRGTSAGGCSNEPYRFLRNPQYRISLPATLPLGCTTTTPNDATSFAARGSEDRVDTGGYWIVLLLECAKELSVNLRLFPCMPQASVRGLRMRQVLSSGSYRAGCAALHTSLPAGAHTFVASTFAAGDCASFQLAMHIAPVVRGFGSRAREVLRREALLYSIPSPFSLDFALPSQPQLIDCKLEEVNIDLQPFSALFKLNFRHQAAKTGRQPLDSIRAGVETIAIRMPVRHIDIGFDPTVTLLAARLASTRQSTTPTPLDSRHEGNAAAKAPAKGKDAVNGLECFSLVANDRYEMNMPAITRSLLGVSGRRSVQCDSIDLFQRRCDFEAGKSLERKFSQSNYAYYKDTRAVTLSAVDLPLSWTSDPQEPTAQGLQLHYFLSLSAVESDLWTDDDIPCVNADHIYRAFSKKARGEVSLQVLSCLNDTTLERLE